MNSIADAIKRVLGLGPARRHSYAVLRKALGDAAREVVLAHNVATLVVGAPMRAEFEPTMSCAR